MLSKMKMNPDREKFLLQAAGVEYRHCTDFYVYTNRGIIGEWELFGCIWEWALGENWWPKFKEKVIGDEGDGVFGPLFFCIKEEYIYPETFLNALYSFLNPVKEETIDRA